MKILKNIFMTSSLRYSIVGSANYLIPEVGISVINYLFVKLLSKMFMTLQKRSSYIGLINIVSPSSSPFPIITYSIFIVILVR